MIRFSLLCVSVLAGLWAGACSKNTPTAPSTAATLSITPPSTTVLVIGQAQPYAVANAKTGAVVTWSTSNSTVLTIDSDGNATAIAVGIVTITATTDDGQTATLQVQVVPSYQGTWTGAITSTACTDIAGFASINYCARALGIAFPLTLNLAQSGLTISGTMTKSEAGGAVSGNVTGVIGTGGDVILAGTLSGISNGANLSVTLLSWNSLATGTKMTGIGSANVTSQQILGIATVQWSLGGVTLAP